MGRGETRKGLRRESLQVGALSAFKSTVLKKKANMGANCVDSLGLGHPLDNFRGC